MTFRPLQQRFGQERPASTSKTAIGYTIFAGITFGFGAFSVAFGTLLLAVSAALKAGSVVRGQKKVG